MKNRTFTLIRRTVSILWSVILPICVNAQQIGVDEAQHIAAEFFAKGIQHSLKVRHVQMSVSDPVLAYTAKTQDVADFYVFNNSNLSSGFVIVAGNHEQPDILGYSLEGTFDMESAPENFKWWMEQYQQNGTTQRKVSKKFRQSVEPLIKTKWGQEKPFNNSIPHLEGYQPFVTGCTATAIAQVMNYYQYPKQGKGANSYSTTYNGNDALKVTFSADFGSTRYDWNNMLDDYSNGYTNAQSKAVATLMYHVGVSEKTSYSDRSHGSSADLHNGAVAMMEHFDYDLSMETAEREHFTDNEWEEMIYRELEDGRPILYSGKTSSNSGHAFLVHGYNAETGMFAINWGWDGDYDGYYSLASSTSLRPQSGTYYANDAYNYDHTIFIHIKPNEGGLPVPIISTRDKVLMAPMSSNTAISNYNLNRSQDEDVTLRLQFTPLNSGLCSAEFLYGVMFVNKTNGQIIYPENDNVESGSLGVNQYFYFSKKLSFNTSLLQYNGVYEVWPAYSVDNGETWKKMRTNLTNGVPTVTVTGSMILDKPTYTLTYLVDGEIYQTYEVYEGVALIAEPGPTKEGYTFSGWNGLPDTMPAEDVTVTGSFVANTYNLVYIVDEETYKTYKVKQGTTITLEAPPSKEGYTFSGWSEIPATMPAQDLTITGTFTINKYKLTYTVDGTKYKTYEVDYGSTITPEAEPSKDDRVFSGWSEIPATMPAHDVNVSGTFIVQDEDDVDITKVEIDGIYYNLVRKAKIAEVTSGEKKYTGDVVIPTSFKYNGITYNVTAISDMAFENCKDLGSVTISKSVTSIGKSAFRDCSGLISVSIPNSVTSIGESAFYGCESLISITIPDAITSIAYDTFHGCSGLSSLTIPCRVTQINSWAFAGCINLHSIYFPNSIEEIYWDAFQGCVSLTSVNISSLESWCNISFINYPSGGFLIDDSDHWHSPDSSNPLKYAHHLFLNGNEIKELIIPSTITSIKPYAFYKCEGLVSVTMPNSVTSIGEKAFCDCNNISSVTIPYSVTSIGQDTFSGCRGLSSVLIPNSVTDIGENAFYGCGGLTSIVLPNSMRSIRKGTFANCSGLTSLIIPFGITSIDNSAFSGCSGLKTVNISNTVTSIGFGAFSDCGNIKDFYCASDNQPDVHGSDCFDNSYIEYATLHVPAALIDKYKGTEPWSKFGKIITLAPAKYTLTYMVDGVVYKSLELESGTAINNDIKGIKDGYIFVGCSDIPTTMPNNNVIMVGVFLQQGKAYTFQNKSSGAYLVLGEYGVGTAIEHPSELKLEETNNNQIYITDGRYYIGDAQEGLFGKYLTTVTDKLESQSLSISCVIYDGKKYYILKEDLGYIADTFFWGLIPNSQNVSDTALWIVTEVESADGIRNVISDDGEYQIYTLDGKPVETLQKGVNVIKYMNGKLKKVVVK